jgi:hypothetical protein
MKTYRTDVLIFIGVIFLAFIILISIPSQSRIEVQLYVNSFVFVVDRVSMTVLILGPPIFLIFLIRALISRFKSTTTNIGFIIGLILVCMIGYKLIEIQHAIYE